VEVKTSDVYLPEELNCPDREFYPSPVITCRAHVIPTIIGIRYLNLKALYVLIKNIKNIIIRGIIRVIYKVYIKIYI
jgi:hypothetical protein